MDFEGVFDRNSSSPKSLELQSKAKSMFDGAGIGLDLGAGYHRYYAFERSASMSRKSQLTFIRDDFYYPVRRRIMMDMELGDCQLSKLYAYNGLMLSSGTRVDNIEIDKPHRVIVIDKVRDKAYCGEHVHTSFQIRMPYVKGMLHKVDFKHFLSSTGVQTITDIYGNSHRIDDVDIILTKSMFKGYGWLKDCNMTWDDYWNAFRKYNHALYITNVSHVIPQEYTDLNYQFISTLAITDEEFRPKDLPDGWDHSPNVIG